MVHMLQRVACHTLWGLCCTPFWAPLSTCAAGILICEGSEEDVAEFVQRLRALRWKAMAVRLGLLHSGLDAHSES